MGQIFIILMIAAMILTALAMFAGIISMAQGKEFNKKYGNKLMQARVIFQGLALAFFAAAVMAYG